jgi:hypothetical protein
MTSGAVDLVLAELEAGGDGVGAGVKMLQHSAGAGAQGPAAATTRAQRLLLVQGQAAGP